MIRVVLVDDQEMIRVGLSGILKTGPGLEVVGEAADGIQAVALIKEKHPDVVLMDIRMPGIDGVEAVRRIRADHNLDGVKIVVLTTFENDQNVVRAIQAGAQGFLGKDIGPSELIAAIEQVAAGGSQLSASATQSLVSHVAESSRGPVDKAAESALAALTPRELAVLKQAATGLTNDEIASQLFISPYTVKTHLNRAMTKTGTTDRSQLIILAFRAGLVDPF
ncbi:DNA-binding NarL/FixJ family response regulator [Pseudarthrobacter sp. PvP004]|uniref:response regulator n=1 Tax=Pseudarthrobacter sp. PvP004 TaxID=2817850 RepID=UPI001AE8DA33|nr:response regulator transcription factor [Pseudarthrobacter sp. PvP004]MBP2266371.1 DNA-binding NarL/FixJ family response regulator [Pseudarthrobacter sp. PvP004]